MKCKCKSEISPYIVLELLDLRCENWEKYFEVFCLYEGTFKNSKYDGSGTWYLLEKMVKNLSEKIGFRSEFSYEKYITKYNLNILKIINVNIFNLSKLIVIKNSSKK